MPFQIGDGGNANKNDASGNDACVELGEKVRVVEVAADGYVPKRTEWFAGFKVVATGGYLHLLLGCFFFCDVQRNRGDIYERRVIAVSGEP